MSKYHKSWYTKYYTETAGATKTLVDHNASGTDEPHELMGIRIENSNSDTIYLRFKDVSATADWDLAVDANTFSVKVAAGGSFIDRFDIPVHYFEKGICIAVTEERSAGSTAPTAATVTVELWVNRV